ncbi:MAG: hypothetical protein AAGK47_00140 [Bacteroidota bacterium]
MKILTLLTILLLLLIGLPSGTAQAHKFRLPNELDEVSGLHIASPDRFWWLTDSGTPPVLYLTDGLGCPVEKRLLRNIKNVDWEELSTDSKGNIYIFDTGNNRNNRRDLTIYQYQPATEEVRTIRVRYPDQTAFPPAQRLQNFDVEGAFWHRDSLHLFSKNTLKGGNYITKHYIVPATEGTHTAILRDSLYLKNRVVTAAALSPDGRTVALLAYNFKRLLGFLPVSGASIFLFSDFPEGQFLKGKRRKIGTKSFLLATQFESIDWLDNETLYIASEKTVFIRPKSKRIRVPTNHRTIRN